MHLNDNLITIVVLLHTLVKVLHPREMPMLLLILHPPCHVRLFCSGKISVLHLKNVNCFGLEFFFFQDLPYSSKLIITTIIGYFICSVQQNYSHQFLRQFLSPNSFFPQTHFFSQIHFLPAATTVLLFQHRAPNNTEAMELQDVDRLVMVQQRYEWMELMCLPFIMPQKQLAPMQ